MDGSDVSISPSIISSSMTSTTSGWGAGAAVAAGSAWAAGAAAAGASASPPPHASPTMPSTIRPRAPGKTVRFIMYLLFDLPGLYAGSFLLDSIRFGPILAARDRNSRAEGTGRSAMEHTCAKVRLSMLRMAMQETESGLACDLTPRGASCGHQLSGTCAPRKLWLDDSDPRSGMVHYLVPF